MSIIIREFRGGAVSFLWYNHSSSFLLIYIHTSNLFSVQLIPPSSVSACVRVCVCMKHLQPHLHKCINMSRAEQKCSAMATDSISRTCIGDSNKMESWNRYDMLVTETSYPELTHTKIGNNGWKKIINIIIIIVIITMKPSGSLTKCSQENFYNIHTIPRQRFLLFTGARVYHANVGANMKQVCV